MVPLILAVAGMIVVDLNVLCNIAGRETLMKLGFIVLILLILENNIEYNINMIDVKRAELCL